MGMGTRKSNKSHPCIIIQWKYPHGVTRYLFMFHYLNLLSMLVIQSIKKSENFSSESAFVSVRFNKCSAGGSKFAIGCLNDSEYYSATYNLAAIYPEFFDKENKTFNAKKAFERFIEEMVIGEKEDINGYEFPIAELSNGKFEKVRIAGTEREMLTMRPACYGDAVHARQLCVNALRRQIADKTLIPIVDDKKDDDEDDE